TTLCFLFFLFSCTTIFTINKNYKKEVIRINEESLKQSKQISDSYLKDFLNYTHIFYQNDTDLAYLLTEEQFTDISSIKASRLMAKLTSYSQLVDSYYIINKRAGYVVTSLEPYQSLSDFYDKGILRQLDEVTNISTSLLFLPREVERNEVQQKVISLVFISSPKSAFVVNFNQEKLVSMMNGDGKDTSSKSILVNGYGMVLSHYEKSLYGTDLKSSDIWKEIIRKNVSSGTFNMVVDNQRQFISYQTDSNGLTFIKITPDLLLDTTNSLLQKALGYTLVFLLLGIAACLLLSILLYRPILSLHKTVSYPRTRLLHGDELEEIAKRYHSIQEQNSTLLKKAHAYQSEGKAKIVKQLLNSSFASIPPLLNNVEELELNLKGPDYLVTLLRLDTAFPNVHEEDYSLILYSIENILNELCQKDFQLECVYLNSITLVCIVNHEPEKKEEFTELLHQTQLKISQYFHVTFSCGIGSSTSELEQVTISYKQAVTAINHKLIAGPGKINHFSSLHFIPDEEQTYPFAIDKAIRSSIRTLSLSNTAEAIIEFIQTIRTFSYEGIVISCLQLNNTFKQLEIQYNLGTSENNLLTFHFFEDSTLQEIQELFLARAEDMIASLAEIRNNNPERNSVVEQVKVLVQKNIYNPNLSVEILAQEVHLSVNYLRNIFKENTGNSLSNYIIEQKLELIFKLLSETDMTIQDISDKLGFSTRNYFFTFFKKHTGYTPSQYRKLHSKKEYIFN
ncbi:helix-turn-helix domain-containing protein, partial [Clostridium sp. HBUAS56010]|uniref:helix-turn-helix domain-containing protein n=1 Tax=Clostridium sp. HBUAS56010 TaxID=2571127 RepID=UPI00163DB287